MHVQYCSSFLILPLYFNVNCITVRRYVSPLCALVAERIPFASDTEKNATNGKKCFLQKLNEFFRRTAG